MLTNRYTFILLLIFILSACATRKAHFAGDYQQKGPDSRQPDYSILFFGGADKSPDNSAPALNGLRDQLAATKKGSLILLGNNGAKRGLPDSTGSATNQRVKKILEDKLSTVKSFNGDVFIVPGNHDWANGGKVGTKGFCGLKILLKITWGRMLWCPARAAQGLMR